jgi:hypothetical protein
MQPGVAAARDYVGSQPGAIFPPIIARKIAKD